MILFVLSIIAAVYILILVETGRDPLPKLNRSIRYINIVFSRRMRKNSFNNYFIVFCVLFFLALFYLFPYFANHGRYSEFVLMTIPFSIGFLFAIILSINKEKRLGKLCKIGLIPIAALFIVLVIYAGEGIICLIFYSPVVLFPYYFGIIIGYSFQSKLFIRNVSVLILVLLNVSASQTSVSTSNDKMISNEIIINASQQQVWNKLTHKFQFGESNNFFFKNGVSYPLQMSLKQNNKLECIYNNGIINAKVLTVDSLHILRFAFIDSLASMKEMSIYKESRTMHIYNHFFINYGEFKIEPINNHQVKLIATTNFKHKLNPEMYADLWLDYLITNLHEHVLQNVKKQCESN